MTAYSGVVVPERDRRRHLRAGLDWLSDGVVIEAQLSTTDTTAIVHPHAFTNAMMNAARSRNSSIMTIVERAEIKTRTNRKTNSALAQSCYNKTPSTI
jgi:hypothetical protein